MNRVCIAALMTGLLACDAEPDKPIEHPRSLEATQIDGRLAFDHQGELVLDEDAQRIFDYFLTAEGELSPTELDAWVAEQLRAGLGDEQAHARAMEAWSAYLAFRREAAVLLESARDPADLGQALLAAVDEHLGDTPLAIAERRRLEHGFAIHRALLLGDPQARAAELARLGADESRRFAATRAGRYLAGRRVIALAGHDPDSVAALRQQHFDAFEPGATERLAALDTRREVWAERVREHEAARERLLGTLEGESLEAALAELEATHFPTVAERRRVRALRAIRDRD